MDENITLEVLFMPEDKKEKFFNSGMFNSYITAYMVNAMYNTGISKEQIQNALDEVKRLFDEIDGSQAKERAKGIIGYDLC